MGIKKSTKETLALILLVIVSLFIIAMVLRYLGVM